MFDPSLINNSQPEQKAPARTNEGHDKQTATFPWLRSYEDGVPAHLNIPDQPLTWLLDTTASRFPGRTALVYFGTKITYAQLSQLANRFAVQLQRLGIRKGDRVAIALPNIPQYPIAFYGALRAGAVVVPTNPTYTPREMQHQMADSGARLLIMLDMFYPTVREIRKDTAIEHVILTGVADYLPPVLRLLYPLSQRGAKLPQPALTEKEFQKDATLHLMSDLLRSQKPPLSRNSVEVFNLPVAARPDDLAILQYTGGTTGLSKGAMLTHRNLLSNAYQARYWTPHAREGEEVSMCVAPFFHSYGLTVCMNLSILAAATMVLLPRFKAKDVIKAVRRYRPTIFPGIPTMYIALLKEVGEHTEDLQSIKFCISGAAALPAKVQSDFEAATHGKLVEGYGLSETSPVTHCNPLTDKCKNGSIGIPLPNVEAAIMDSATGELLPPEETGELVIKGPNVMQGYWQREEETKAIFRDGWMRTGDIAKMDEDGFFYIVDRAKDLIIAGGFNIFPREVEEVLFGHPAIAEGAVVGMPDEYRGESVAAFVVLKAGIEPTEQTRQDILSYCKQHLAAYKVPKKLEFRESLPKTLVGKVLRRELKVTT